MASKKQRSKSAKPGLMTTTNKELEASLMRQRDLDYSESKRATSAHGNRRKGEGTGHVLPRARPADEEKMRTYYASQFEAKAVDAEDRQARPTSSTRRNNPHPQLEFMQWRLPVRVLESREGTIQAPMEQLLDTNQSFYQDYRTGNDGDAGNEVSTNIARSDFVGTLDPNAAGPDTTATVEFPGYPGTKCRSNTGKLASLASKTGVEEKPRIARPSSASTKKNVIGVAVQGKNQATKLESWMESDAPDIAKTTVMSMLKSGTTEEMRLKKALQSTLAEEAMPGVEAWVKTATDRDRKLVLQVFEGLSDAHQSSKRQPQAEDILPPLSPTRVFQRPASTRPRSHMRRASDPLPFAENHPVPVLYRGTGAEKILKFNRTRPLGSRATSRARSASVNGRAVSTLENTLEQLAVDAGVDGSEARFSPMPSMRWHAYSKREHTPNVVHRGAIFGGPKKVGSHWSICPEWPIA